MYEYACMSVNLYVIVYKCVNLNVFIYVNVCVCVYVSWSTTQSRMVVVGIDNVNNSRKVERTMTELEYEKDGN